MMRKFCELSVLICWCVYLDKATIVSGAIYHNTTVAVSLIHTIIRTHFAVTECLFQMKLFILFEYVFLTKEKMKMNNKTLITTSNVSRKHSHEHFFLYKRIR